MDHLLVVCAVTAQIWVQFWSTIGLRWFITVGQVTFEDYWTAVRGALQRKQKRSLDSCIILVAWMIWKERNSIAFRREITSVDLLLVRICDEFSHWHIVGVLCLEALSSRE